MAVSWLTTVKMYVKEISINESDVTINQSTATIKTSWGQQAFLIKEEEGQTVHVGDYLYDLFKIPQLCLEIY